MATVSEVAGMSGARKAAILLTMLGEEAAATIIRNLSEEDQHRVAEEVCKLGAVPHDVNLRVCEEYKLIMTGGIEDSIHGGKPLARRFLIKAFGEAEAEEILQRLSKSRELNPKEALQRADPQKLARVLESELPQTIALVLGQLGDKQASALLMSLPSDIRANAVKRLANLRRFSPEMAQKVSMILSKRMKALGEQGKKKYSGFESVATIMNCIDTSVAQEILERIESDEPNLANSIRDLMFTFNDLLNLADAHIREVTAMVDKRVLATALKGTSDEMKGCFFKTMSSRAVEMLKEDIEALGAVRNRDVLKAQSEIVSIARQLEAEGKIVLKSESTDEYVV